MDDLRQILLGDELVNRAAPLHRKGDLAAAEGLYLQALTIQSDHFDALHSLGFLRYQQERFAEALFLIGAALKASPDFPGALVNYAVVLQALDRPAEALAIYDRVLAIKPDAIDALYNRGNALRDYYRGTRLQDLNYNAYDKALAIPPRPPDMLTYRGIALKDLSRPAEALASFDRALAIQPEHIVARNNRDTLLRDVDHPDLDHPAEGLTSRDSLASRNPMGQQHPGGSPVRVTYGYNYQSDPAVAVQQPSNRAKHEMALAVARAFEPKRVIGFGKVRLGRDFDGGYVLVDDFAGVGAALSCGISDDATWDLAIAKRNIPVHQFDHTIEKGPIEHPLLSFHKQRVAAADALGTLCLDSMAERFLPDCGRAILKIDIEGDEWQAF